MKKSLPKKSKSHEPLIREITDIIVNSAKDKIAFVILFGSFARGTWVFDRYSEGRILYQYSSDYDFLIITKTGRQASGSPAFDLKRKINQELKNRHLISKYQGHNPHFVIESIATVNGDLEKSKYFFSDIKKEGILLYDSGEFELSKPKKLNEKEKKKIAKEDYEYWMNSAEQFSYATETMMSKNFLTKSAFQLHQVTESLYNCALLTLGGYKPKSHDLIELNQLCSVYSNDFLTIFPNATKEQETCFELLQKAYIDARYKKNYKITKDQLEYLISRVEKLKSLVEKICLEKI